MAWGRKVMEENIRTAVVIFFFVIRQSLLPLVLRFPQLEACCWIVRMKLFLRLQRWASPALTPTPSFYGKGDCYSGYVYGRIGPVTLVTYCAAEQEEKDVDIQRP